MTARILSLLAGGALILSAGTSPIGVLTTVGSARMDNVEVRGSGTVLEGSVIETAQNPAQLSLKNGARFELSANSRAQVYVDRFLLEKGSSQIHSSSGSPVVVNSLSIAPEASSTIRVFKLSPKTLEVSAVSGHAEVRNASGLLIAKVSPGAALDFDNQPGASGPTKVSGKVFKSGDHYMLTDTTTNTTVELQGDNLESTVGHCIAATGSPVPNTPAATGASQLIHVVGFETVSCRKQGGGAAAGAAAGGLSTGAKVAIISGIAVGGGIGGAAAAGAFSGGNARTASAP